MPGWLEIVIRSFVAIALLFLAGKWFVRRSSKDLSTFRLMAAVSIGVIAAFGSINLNIPPALWLICFATWIAVLFFADWLAVKSRRWRDVWYGKPITIIQDQKLLDEALKRHRLTTVELMNRLRQKQVFNWSDVEFAVLEPNGEVNALLKKEQRPLSPLSAQVPVVNEKEPVTVIEDGKVLDDALARLGYDRRWLEKELEKLDVAIENVFFAQADDHGQVHVDIFADNIEVPQPAGQQLLLAAIKKCLADVESFALETENNRAKAMYEACSEDLKQMEAALTTILR